MLQERVRCNGGGSSRCRSVATCRRREVAACLLISTQRVQTWSASLASSSLPLGSGARLPGVNSSPSSSSAADTIESDDPPRRSMTCASLLRPFLDRPLIPLKPAGDMGEVMPVTPLSARTVSSSSYALEPVPLRVLRELELDPEAEIRLWLFFGDICEREDEGVESLEIDIGGGIFSWSSSRLAELDGVGGKKRSSDLVEEEDKEAEVDGGAREVTGIELVRLDLGVPIPTPVEPAVAVSSGWTGKPGSWMLRTTPFSSASVNGRLRAEAL